MLNYLLTCFASENIFRMALQRPWENYIRIIFKLSGKVRWPTLAVLALGRQRKEDGYVSRTASGAQQDLVTSKI